MSLASTSQTRLSATTEHLGRLLHILRLAELSAMDVFDRLSRAPELPTDITAAFQRICRDECRHELLLETLIATLPPIAENAVLTLQAQRFLRQLHTRDPYQHALRIAALDSGACRIFSQLLRRRAALEDAPLATSTLKTIWRDEARHVAITTRFAYDRLVSEEGVCEFMKTRCGLADLLSLSADSFNALGVDFDHLYRALVAGPITRHNHLAASPKFLQDAF